MWLMGLNHLTDLGTTVDLGPHALSRGQRRSDDATVHTCNWNGWAA
jgi:hypothetical protein